MSTAAENTQILFLSVITHLPARTYAQKMNGLELSFDPFHLWKENENRWSNLHLPEITAQKVETDSLMSSGRVPQTYHRRQFYAWSCSLFTGKEIHLHYRPLQEKTFKIFSCPYFFQTYQIYDEESNERQILQMIKSVW